MILIKAGFFYGHHGVSAFKKLIYFSNEELLLARLKGLELGKQLA